MAQATWLLRFAKRNSGQWDNAQYTQRYIIRCTADDLLSLTASCCVCSLQNFTAISEKLEAL